MTTTTMMMKRMELGLAACAVLLLAAGAVLAKANEDERKLSGVVAGNSWVASTGGDAAKACGAGDTSSSCRENTRVVHRGEANEQRHGDRDEEGTPARDLNGKRPQTQKQGDAGKGEEKEVDEAIKQFKRRKPGANKLPSAAILLLGILGILVFNVYKVSSRLHRRRQEWKQKRIMKQLGVNKEREKAMQLMKENERKVEQMTRLLASMQNNLGRELRERKRAVETLTEFSSALEESTGRETTFT